MCYNTNNAHNMYEAVYSHIQNIINIYLSKNKETFLLNHHMFDQLKVPDFSVLCVIIVYQIDFCTRSRPIAINSFNI